MKAKSLDEHIETAIEGQFQLNQEAQLLARQWSQLTPQEMADRCEELNTLLQNISTSDNDLRTILELAGPESVNHPRLLHYKNLIEETMKLYDDISAKALNHKKMIQNELLRLKKNRVGLAGYGNHSSTSGNIVKESC